MSFFAVFFLQVFRKRLFSLKRHACGSFAPS